MILMKKVVEKQDDYDGLSFPDVQRMANKVNSQF